MSKSGLIILTTLAYQSLTSQHNPTMDIDMEDIDDIEAIFGSLFLPIFIENVVDTTRLEIEHSTQQWVNHIRTRFPNFPQEWKTLTPRDIILCVAEQLGEKNYFSNWCQVHCVAMETATNRSPFKDVAEISLLIFGIKMTMDDLCTYCNKNLTGTMPLFGKVCDGCRKENGLNIMTAQEAKDKTDLTDADLARITHSVVDMNTGIRYFRSTDIYRASKILIQKKSSDRAYKSRNISALGIDMDEIAMDNLTTDRKEKIKEIVVGKYLQFQSGMTIRELETRYIVAKYIGVVGLLNKPNLFEAVLNIIEGERVWIDMDIAFADCKTIMRSYIDRVFRMTDRKGEIIQTDNITEKIAQCLPKEQLKNLDRVWDQANSLKLYDPENIKEKLKARWEYVFRKSGYKMEQVHPVEIERAIKYPLQEEYNFVAFVDRYAEYYKTSEERLEEMARRIAARALVDFKKLKYDPAIVQYITHRRAYTEGELEAELKIKRMVWDSGSNMMQTSNVVLVKYEMDVVKKVKDTYFARNAGFTWKKALEEAIYDTRLDYKNILLFK
jgi:hypothetical protein